jgi:polysaccharide pyruvyl transferase WcaK-like protein/coenzyme F420-reducing hydrogenase beta subunit
MTAAADAGVHRPAGPRRVALAGATFSGNKGAAAMLEAAVSRLSEVLPQGSRFPVFSLYPGRDRNVPLPLGVELVPASTVTTAALLPCAALLWALTKSIPVVGRRVARFRPLRALLDCDMLLDLSGISFSDGRGIPTLLYNVALVLPALLCGIPVIKMSQALGPFREPLNRFAAKAILSRMRLIFCRGEKSLLNVESLGLTSFTAAADLAFLLDEGMAVDSRRDPGGRKLVGIAPSEVLARACAAEGIDYPDILSAVIHKLRADGLDVVVIAHSNLGPESRSKNNDFRICDDLRKRLEGSGAEFILEDLRPSALRALIGRCDVFVASRFHSMISALCTCTPSVVTSWGHKYTEVMREFGLEDYVVPSERLSFDILYRKIMLALQDIPGISSRIEGALPAAMRSASSQIGAVAELLGRQPFRAKAGARASRLAGSLWSGNPPALAVGSAVETVERHFASGGLVSELLAHRLRSGAARASICARCRVSSGRVELETAVCRRPEEVFSCSGSIYSDFNHLGGVISALAAEVGPCDVVVLPCQARALRNAAMAHPDLAARLGLVVGLWCGHATSRTLLDDLLITWGVDTGRMQSFRYRMGHWRGESEITLTGGAAVRRPFAHGYGLHQNMYADCALRCLVCTDHFASCSDVSFGDAWLPGARVRSRKYSMALQHTPEGRAAIEELAASGSVVLYQADPALAVRAQYRALRWHRQGSASRSAMAGWFGLRLPKVEAPPARLNDMASSLMVLAAVKAYSGPLRRHLLGCPWWVLYPWLLAQKGFLNL